MLFHRHTSPPRLLFAAGLVTVAVLAAACSGSNSAGLDGQQESKTTVRFGVFNWDAAAITSQILIQVTKKYPALGVNHTSTKTLSTAPGWIGLGRGDVDVLTEVAWPNQKPLYEKQKQNTALLSTTYNNGAQGWFVPTYAVQPGGAAAGLTDVTQLCKYAGKFDHKLYDGPNGWITSKWNSKRLEGYHLAGCYEHVKAGETSYIAQLKHAYARKQPILLYLWHPHWVFGQYKLTQVKEPNPYHKGCFTNGDDACAMPPQEAHIAARKDLRKKTPRFYAFLKEFKVSIPDMDNMLAAHTVNHESFRHIATSWVAGHKSELDSWTAKAKKQG